MLSLILLTYLLEDVAIFTAALLAADQSISSSYALIAVFIGVATGDIALYGLGWWATKSRRLRYWLLKRRRLKSIKRALQQKVFTNIFIIRFIPGLRTLGYSLSGFYRVSFTRFCAAVLLATAIWTLLIFTLVFHFGALSFWQDSPLKWALLPLGLVLLWQLNRTMSKNLALASS
ncbi:MULTISPECIES: DedA family protein [unclassified Vibrio]|uniref:VTT domain-containing protein n=1 Tax=Vibrio sp. HB236076 TaxID=3232307 RepID=A0AB39HKK0_9VIBR|nr:VTT domain-containing protein [Vibrio sp. HB161653]MDP5253070.1 VTT domain-containing protein [Vibrio sp. HB161653]